MDRLKEYFLGCIPILFFFYSNGQMFSKDLLFKLRGHHFLITFLEIFFFYGNIIIFFTKILLSLSWSDIHSKKRDKFSCCFYFDPLLQGIPELEGYSDKMWIERYGCDYKYNESNLDDTMCLLK